jgi:hypothetical protein
MTRRLPKVQRITTAAVAAFKARDRAALHLALDFCPWHPSPLPREVEELGVDFGPAPDWWNEADWRFAQELRRKLEKATQ